MNHMNSLSRRKARSISESQFDDTLGSKTSQTRWLLLALGLALFVGFVAFFGSMTAMAEPSDAKRINTELPPGFIPIESNMDILFMTALTNGKGVADGQYVGKAAQLINQQFDGTAPVRLRATVMKELVDGCPKIILKVYQEGGKEQEVPIKACKN